LICLVCLGSLFAHVGCQRTDEPARIAVSGIVTSPEGEPVNGTISFLPQAGTEGPAATTSLVDGVYVFDRANGPIAGEYRVLVVLTPDDRKQKSLIAPAANAPPAKTSPETRPATDHEWSFTANVAPDNTEFDFELREE
jgi:hypothetical protein